MASINPSFFLTDDKRFAKFLLEEKKQRANSPLNKTTTNNPKKKTDRGTPSNNSLHQKHTKSLGQTTK